MSMRAKATFLLVLLLALAGAIPVAAAEVTDEELLPCAEGAVSGVVTAVDPDTGTVVVETGEGLCTVTLDGEYDHPIVNLLGAYFAEVSAKSLAEALAATQVCAVYDSESEEWSWADCDDPGAVDVTVTGEAEADPCAFTVQIGEEQVTLVVEDEDTCAGVGQGLEGPPPICAVYDSESEAWSWAGCEDEGAVEVTVTGETESCTFTVETESGEATITVGDEAFCEDVSQGLEPPPVCAVQDPITEEWSWADCEDPEAVEVPVTGADEADPCAFAAETEEGDPIVLLADEDACADLDQALDALGVEWDVDDEGTLIGTGDDIAAYHDEGMGFGVLVKLYAMADEYESPEDCTEAEGMCGITVEELAALFRSGTGMGQLFKEYGKPSKLGVGHVRHADDEGSADEESSDDIGLSSSSQKQNGKPDGVGPKTDKETGKPDHAGPKPKSADKPGKPAHAGPKAKKNR